MSEITFAIAKIGGGKSLFAASQICRELERSERMIVTNLATWLFESPNREHLSLADWCWKYVDRPVDVGKRVRILKRNEVRDFYLHYPGFDLSLVNELGSFAGYDVKPETQGQFLPNLDVRQRLQVDGKVPFGCLFILDEIHLYFSSREWQKTGVAVEHYMSQLRKLNDDVLLITQEAGKVDKNFRRNATEWIYFQNMSRVRLWGGVTFKNRFRFRVFQQEPQRGDEPCRTGTFQLMDKEFHKVFDTMSGVGLAGHLIPEESKKHGGHWVRWVAIGVFMLAVAVVVPRVLLHASGYAVHKALSSFQTGFGNVITNSPGLRPFVPSVPSLVPFIPVNPVKLERTVRVVAPVVSELKETNELSFSGYSTVMGIPTVYFTDGTCATLGDGHLTEFVAGRYCVFDGQRVKYRKLEPEYVPALGFPTMRDAGLVNRSRVLRGN